MLHKFITVADMLQPGANYGTTDQEHRLVGRPQRLQHHRLLTAWPQAHRNRGTPHHQRARPRKPLARWPG